MGTAATMVFVVIGCIGYVSAWIGFLMAFAACWGFEKMAGSIKVFDVILCGIIAVALVYPGSMLVVSYWVYREVLKDLGVSLIDTIRSAGWLIETYEEVEDSLQELLVSGFLYTILGVVLYIISFFGKRKAEKLNQITIQELGTKKSQWIVVLLMILGVFLCLGSVIVADEFLHNDSFAIVGIVLMFACIIAGVVVSVKAQPARLTFNDEGLLFNDKEGNSTKKLAKWDEFSSYRKDDMNEMITLNKKDGSVLNISTKRFPDLKLFTDKLEALFGAGNDPFGYGSADYEAKFNQDQYLQ
jgi:hypothetical protein